MLLVAIQLLEKVIHRKPRWTFGYCHSNSTLANGESHGSPCALYLIVVMCDIVGQQYVNALLHSVVLTRWNSYLVNTVIIRLFSCAWMM